jgi:CSLREA domain-containing protein
MSVAIFTTGLKRNQVLRFTCLLFCLFTILTVRAQAANFTVSKVADTSDGVCNADCSLREAILASNNNGPGADVITFNTGFVLPLTPTSSLPAITGSLTIDGGSNVNGYPLTELSGTSAGANADGLVVSSPASAIAITVIIKNLAVNRFNRHGIFVNSFAGVNFALINCALGTNTLGTIDQGNGQHGIRIFAYANSTFTIGDLGSTNVISGNGGDGIAIVTASNITDANTEIFIWHNRIGTTEVGLDDLGNSGNGISVTGSSTGYKVAVGDTVVGLRNTISGNNQNGIYAASNQLLVYNNYIGTGSGGISGLANSLDGIRLDGNVNATIGGTVTTNNTSVDVGNLISGNGGNGVSVISHNATVAIKRNIIGLHSGTTSSLPNGGHGVEVKDPSAFATANVVIGSDTNLLDSNLICGNANFGISIDEKVGGVQIYGNRLGLTSNNVSIPNLGGIRILSAQNKIGAAGNAIAANVIAKNAQRGILLTGSSATGNEIYNNYIGTNSAAFDFGNLGDGILIEGGASANKIGNGLSSGTNVIAFNGKDGVSVVAGTNNTIQANSIHSNTGLGINLGPNGITPNDAGDSDSGANDLQNFPVLIRAHSNQIVGSFNSTPNSSFRIDYYRSDSCDSSGNGEGRFLFGTDTQLTTDQNGNAQINFPLGAGNNQFVTATATQTNAGLSSTSEFSPCIPITPLTGSVKFSSSVFPINEEGTVVSVLVQRVIGSSGAFTVNIHTEDGTAKAGEDYIAQNSILSFADGETSKTIQIPIINDPLNEATESFTVVLSNAPPDVPILSPSTATVTINDNDLLPKFSINDLEATEGNSATKDFVFNVRLSAPSSFDTTVHFQTDDDSPNVGDYQPTSGVLTFVAGQTQKTIIVKVIGDTEPEGDEEFLVLLDSPTNAGISDNQATGVILNDDNEETPIVQFSQATYAVQEDLTSATITVTRTGDLSSVSNVDYATSNWTASQKGDYEIGSGTVTFAANEASKTFTVLINEDSYVEGTETVNLTLHDPAGATLGSQTSAVLNINDDAVESPVNPNDDAQNFVYQQYHDLLNRKPDLGGLAYWTSQITQCGNDQTCINNKRRGVSAAFYIELEFQETGYFVYRVQKASFGSQPTYSLFMADRGRIKAGAQLEQSKQAFADAWVQRAAFTNAYPDAMPADQFVNKLYDTAGLAGYASQRLLAIQDLMSNARTRAQILREVIETPEFKTREYNPSFVLMQYFGYLRRNPDQGGYQFWLNVLNNQLPTDSSGQHAMVCAFITSGEYQDRFSASHTHSNAECGP